MEKLLYRVDSVDVASRYLDKIGALGVDPIGSNISAMDLDEGRPSCFIKGYSLSNPVMIRSYNSGDLLAKSNLL